MRRGMTLVEMLVALTVTLILMGTVMTIFGNVGKSVTDSRSSIEMSERVRNARNRIQADVSGVTALTLPPRRPEDNEGYLEYIEGFQRDYWNRYYDVSKLPLPAESDRKPHNYMDSRCGDVDDILMFTAKSKGQPFVGQFPEWGLISNPTDSSFSAAASAALALDPRQNFYLGRRVAVIRSDNGMPYQFRVISVYSGATGDQFTVSPRFTVTPDPNDLFVLLGRTIESDTAEIVYYTMPDDPLDKLPTDPDAKHTYTLYRRVLLVAPNQIAQQVRAAEVNLGSGTQLPENLLPIPANSENWFFQYFDISARPSPDGKCMIPNTLGDLTKRENRYFHQRPEYELGGNPNNGKYWVPGESYTVKNSYFPNPVRLRRLNNFFQETSLTRKDIVGPFLPYIPSPDRDPKKTVVNARFGEDVIMTGVLAFDIRAYDPLAPVRVDNSTGALLTPCDYGWSGGSNSPLTGAFVDLNYDVKSTISPPYAWFSGPMQDYAGFGLFPSLSAPDFPGKFTLPPHYDTWSWHYEQDGIAQNNKTTADTAFNGLDDDINGRNGVVDDQGEADKSNGVDDNGNSVVDEIGELDTVPPYPKPLRGIQIKLRVYEPDSRQVREVTIEQDFLPQ